MKEWSKELQRQQYKKEVLKEERNKTLQYLRSNLRTGKELSRRSDSKGLQSLALFAQPNQQLQDKRSTTNANMRKEYKQPRRNGSTGYLRTYVHGPCRHSRLHNVRSTTAGSA